MTLLTLEPAAAPSPTIDASAPAIDAPLSVRSAARRDPGAGPSCEEERRGGSFGLSLVEVRFGGGALRLPATDEVCLVRVVAGTGPIEVDLGDGARRAALRPDTVGLRPAGAACRLVSPPVHARILRVPASRLRPLLAVHGAAVSDLAASAGPLMASPTDTAPTAPEIARLIDTIWTASAPPGAARGGASGLLADGAFLTLIARLLAASGRERLCAPVPMVEDVRLQRVLDHAEAHLDRPLSVSELADIACISVYHFARVFRQRVGVTPHRYVMQRRFERAKRLLAEPRPPLASVAAACGFASQSHMTTTFRAQLGMTPLQYRKAVRA